MSRLARLWTSKARATELGRGRCDVVYGRAFCVPRSRKRVKTVVRRRGACKRAKACMLYIHVQQYTIHPSEIWRAFYWSGARLGLQAAHTCVIFVSRCLAVESPALTCPSRKIQAKVSTGIAFPKRSVFGCALCRAVCFRCKVQMCA